MPTNQLTNQTQNNQPAPQAAMPEKKSKVGLCILIAVIVVLLFGAAVFGLVYFIIKDAEKEFNEFFDTSTNVQETVAPTPSKTVSPQITPRVTPQITPQISPVPSGQKFPQASIDYFVEIVLGSEFGNSEETIKKWVKNPTQIKINGNPDSGSLACLDQVVTDFNSLSTTTKLQKNNNSNDIQMYFAPKEQFSQIEPNYIPGNEGFFWEWWNENDEFYKANILITTNNNITQKERCHIIREELTQSMGMANDSYRYPDSIFYIKWTDPTSYSQIDQDVIRMLYATNIPLGANEQTIREYFQ